VKGHFGGKFSMGRKNPADDRLRMVCDFLESLLNKFAKTFFTGSSILRIEGSHRTTAGKSLHADDPLRRRGDLADDRCFTDPRLVHSVQEAFRRVGRQGDEKPAGGLGIKEDVD